MDRERRLKYLEDLRTIELERYGEDIRMPIYRCLSIAGEDSGYEEDHYMRYPDINGDGHVDGLDASIILVANAHIVAGEPTGLTPEQEYLCDTNRDGLIEPLDASWVLRFNSMVVQGLYEDRPIEWERFYREKIEPITQRE